MGTVAENDLLCVGSRFPEYIEFEVFLVSNHFNVQECYIFIELISRAFRLAEWLTEVRSSNLSGGSGVCIVT